MILTSTPRPSNGVAASIRIDPEFQKAIPPSTDAERAGLEEKLKAEGCIDKLRCWENDPEGPSLIDGHHRYEISKRLGIGFSVLGLRFPDRDAVLLWIEENQLSRRNLTDDQRAAISVSVMERRSEAAKRERAITARRAVQARNPVIPDLEAPAPPSQPTQPKSRSRAATAKQAKVPEHKLRAAANVKKAKPELMDKVVQGSMTLKEAAREVREQTPPEPGPGPEPQVDDEGVPVPDHLREAFAKRADFDAVLNHLTRLSGLVNKLMGKQREPVPVGAECLHRQDINNHQDNLRSAIRFGRPHAVCPYCGGSRKTGAETCGGCRGAGWVGEISYKQAPKEYKEKLKGAA